MAAARRNQRRRKNVLVRQQANDAAIFATLLLASPKNLTPAMTFP
jgi:hypothetical protein